MARPQPVHGASNLPSARSRCVIAGLVLVAKGTPLADRGSRRVVLRVRVVVLRVYARSARRSIHEPTLLGGYLGGSHRALGDWHNRRIPLGVSWEPATFTLRELGEKELPAFRSSCAICSVHRTQRETAA